jgi:hypothetical protein
MAASFNIALNSLANIIQLSGDIYIYICILTLPDLRKSRGLRDLAHGGTEHK